MKVSPQMSHLNFSNEPGEGGSSSWDEGGSSLLSPRTGVKLRSEVGGCERSFSAVFNSEDACMLSMWIFNSSPLLKSESHWVHLNSLEDTREETGGSAFFFRKACLRLAFLLFVEGLDLFPGGLTSGIFPLESKEKLKEEPMLTEKVNSWPWLANAWQRARHWEAREEMSSAAAAIFNFTSELRLHFCVIWGPSEFGKS